MEIFEKCRELNSRESNSLARKAIRKINKSLNFTLNEINHDRQKIHIPGPDFVDGKSSITISLERLETLCLEKAGTGVPVNGRRGQSGYREQINFGELIGECRYEKERGV